MSTPLFFKQSESFEWIVKPFASSSFSSGFYFQILHKDQLVGEARLFLAPQGLTGSALLTFLDDIELLAVELFDVAQDQKRVAKSIQKHPFAYLSELSIHPDYQTFNLDSQLLEWIIDFLKTHEIPNLYAVMVADTSLEHQHLHHFYMHHYFTYLLPQHPDKPAVLHRLIEV